MDEQMDSKALVGSHICTEQPGEFRWQPSSLTQALWNGFWVVFEDIDKAPSEIHSILLSLLEGGSTYMIGHGESFEQELAIRCHSTKAFQKGINDFDKQREKLIKIYDEKKTEMKRQHYEEEGELEKEFDAALNELMEAYSHHHA